MPAGSRGYKGKQVIIGSTAEMRVRKRTSFVVSGLVCLFSLAIALTSWTVVRLSGDEQATRLVESSTEQSSKRFEDFAQSRQFVLASLAQTYAAGREIDESSFRRDANVIHSRFDGLLAVNWIAPDSTIIWATPPNQNRAARGRKLLEHPSAAPYYKRAVETGSFQSTPPIELFQGGKGVAGYFPVMRNGELLGTVNGVFRVNSMVESALRGAMRENYAIHIRDGEITVWEDEGFSELAQIHPEVAKKMTVLGRKWTLSLTPRPGLWEVIRPPHNTLLFIGIVCSILIALLTFIALDRQRQKYENLRALRAAERRIQEAQKFDALGRLARGITHDFNNLLTAVGTSAELISLDETLTSAGRENIDAIRVASERATELTQQIMLFGDPKTVTQQSSTKLSDFSERWQRFLQKLVGRRVKVEFEGAPDVLVDLDESSLMRVLTNLVINASDAMPEGGVVSIRWRLTDGEVELEVRDEGVGMTDDVRERIFEPYYTTKGEEGTGLGLPTVYGIVQSAGGTIVVSSTPGEGTTFVVRLPIAN